MSTKIRKNSWLTLIVGCLLTVSSHGVEAEAAADENSLESRLKAFNAPGSANDNSAKNQPVQAAKIASKPVAKKAKKTKVTKRRKYKRACYQSPTSSILDRAESLQPAIRKSSQRYGVSQALIISIITAESCFSRRARSHKNARGLMQLIPATAKRFGVRDAYVPAQNIKGGTRYLKFLLERFSGNLHLAIAAYNAGEGAVDRYSGIPPYKETKEYVRRVMSVYRRIQNNDSATLLVGHSKPSLRTRAAAMPKVRTNSGKPKPVAFAKSSTGKGYFIKPDYQWTRRSHPRRAANFYRTSNHQASTHRHSNHRKSRRACRDVSSVKLKRNSRLVNRAGTMKRYYASSKPRSMSAIARATGVRLSLLLRMNRSASKYMVQPGKKVLVWQCANR